MRISTVLLATASVGAALVCPLGPHMREKGPNGQGNPTGALGNAQSICMFSGLEDGSEGGPLGPGTTQNWGQIPKKVIRGIIALQGEHPGDACNGHTGFLVRPVTCEHDAHQRARSPVTVWPGVAHLSTGWAHSHAPIGHACWLRQSARVALDVGVPCRTVYVHPG